MTMLKENPRPCVRLNLFLRSLSICFQSTGSPLICYNSSSISPATSCCYSSFRNAPRSGDAGIMKNAMSQLSMCRNVDMTGCRGYPTDYSTAGAWIICFFTCATDIIVIESVRIKVDLADCLYVLSNDTSFSTLSLKNILL